MTECTSSPRGCSDRVEAVLRSGEPTPFLVTDLDVVADRYRTLRSALGDAEVFYAVKANAHPDLLAALVALGCCFDVASIGEVKACLDAGAGPGRLSFGNTVKRRSEVAAAHGLGVPNFAVDDAAELAKVVAAAPGAAVTVRLRCDGDGAAWPLSRKFGCGAEAAVDLLVEARRRGMGELGISFHVGSQQSRPEAWDEALAVVASVADAAADRGAPLGLVNLGGGLPSNYDAALPEVEGYAKVISDGLDRHLARHDVRLVIEPGRHLVAEAGVIQAEVLLVSRSDDDDGPRWIFLDVGVYTGLVEAMGEAIRYPMRTPHDGGPLCPSVVAGPTCDSVDVLYEVTPYQLPLALAEGDRVELFSAGAYTSACTTVGFNGFPPLREIVLPLS
ncbi:MAG: type III PLP-dependent enzyme [Microthrixaceae bacterium]|nr:type III PLP-dependent enzyme [Microthrixaceae bacterium]